MEKIKYGILSSVANIFKLTNKSLSKKLIGKRKSENIEIF
jgi:hypothetical protein